MSLATLRQLEAKAAELTSRIEGGIPAGAQKKLAELRGLMLTMTPEIYLQKVEEVVQGWTDAQTFLIKERDRTSKHVDMVTGKFYPSHPSVGPIGQSPYALITVNPPVGHPNHEPEIPVIAPDKLFVQFQEIDKQRFASLLGDVSENVAAKLNDLYQAAQDNAKTFNSLCRYLEQEIVKDAKKITHPTDKVNRNNYAAVARQTEDEAYFVRLLAAVPKNIGEVLHCLYRRKGDALAPNGLETMAQQVGATDPDLYMPYTMTLPVNTPLPAITIVPAPQHPFDAAKEAKVKLAKEAEAKKAAEAAKVKQERDEKVGGAIKRAFR